MRAHPVVHFGLFVIALLAHGACQASCIFATPSGFPHATVDRYPAGLKGVLFAAPEATALDAADFEVSTAGQGPSPGVRVTPLDIARRDLVANDLRDDMRLVRIELAAGYMPGITYTVRYLPASKYRTVYPHETRFTVDRGAVDLAGAGIKLSFAGSALQRRLTVWSGDAGIIFEVAVRDFKLALPDSLLPYAAAISVFSEVSKGAGEAESAFAPLHPERGGCAGKRFGGAPGGIDAVFQQCESPLRPVRVRAWIGMLEVDERLLPTAPLLVEWGEDVAQACRAAVASNDRR